jgi:hypothetical protein
MRRLMHKAGHFSSKLEPPVEPSCCLLLTTGKMCFAVFIHLCCVLNIAEHGKKVFAVYI